METQVKIKNTNEQGQSLRLQYWNGKLPTYDSDAQRAAVHQARAVGADENGNALNQDELKVGTNATTQAPNEEAQAQANIAAAGDAAPEKFTKNKMNKAELVQLAGERGLVVDNEKDTIATLRERISGTFAAETASTDPVANKTGVATPKAAGNAGTVREFAFTSDNLLQEQTITPGEEKLITLSGDVFVTIKIDA